VNIFFREERLPIKEGWKRSLVPINEDTISMVTDQIDGAADWKADSDCPTITFVLTTNASETLQL
jgi:hypothetical protein